MDWAPEWPRTEFPAFSKPNKTLNPGWSCNVKQRHTAPASDARQA